MSPITACYNLKNRKIKWRINLWLTSIAVLQADPNNKKQNAEFISPETTKRILRNDFIVTESWITVTSIDKQIPVA
jgi:hypothetical protein